MTFLNPAILFGLIAAGIPVMLHLLNLKRLKKIEFSTLAFLKEIQKSKIKRVKLKQWLLLALRILIIVFLVTSFARPTIQTASIAGTTSTSKSTDVFILDNSFSMSVVADNGSLFNRGKQIIKDILTTENDGDERYLILTGSSDNNFDLSNKAAFVKSLDDAQISYISRSIEELLDKAKNILSNSGNINKNIYLISDLQKSTLRSDKSNRAKPDLSNFNDVNLYTFEQPGNNINNLAVVDLKSNNQLFELNKEISFTAKVENFSAFKIENTIASLFINGRREAQHSINIEPFGTTQIDFQTTLKTTGVINISCSLEDDDVLQDNNRYLAIFVPGKINLLIATDNPSDAKYVELALAGSADNNDYTITHKSNLALQSIDLTKYDLLVVIGTTQIEDPQNLLNYINNGGQTILMPGKNSSENDFSKTMSALKLPSNLREVSSSSSITEFENVDFNHPLLANLFEDNSEMNIVSPKLKKYFYINTQGKGKSIISLTDNSAFLSEYGIGKGRVLVYSAAPVLSWSDFPLKAIFAPLINKSILYLATDVRQENIYYACDEVYVNIKKNVSRQVQVNRPDNTKEYLNIDSAKTQNYFKYTNTDLIGVYEFIAKGNVSDYITINTNPRESNPNTATQEEFNTFLDDLNFPGNHVDVPLNADIPQLLTETRTGSELWKLFLIIALILSIVEMFVSKSYKKDLVELNQQ